MNKKRFLISMIFIGLKLQSCGEQKESRNGPAASDKSLESTNLMSAKSESSASSSDLIPMVSRPGVFTVQIVPKSSEAWAPPKGLTYKRVINWREIRSNDGWWDSLHYATCGEAVYNGSADPSLKGKTIAYLNRVDPGAAKNRQSELAVAGVPLAGHNAWPYHRVNMRQFAYVGRCSYLLFSSTTRGGSYGGRFGSDWHHLYSERDNLDQICGECEPYRFGLYGRVLEEPRRRILDDQQFLQFFPRVSNLNDSIRFAIKSFKLSGEGVPSRSAVLTSVYGQKIANGYNRFKNDEASGAVRTGWLTLQEPSIYSPLKSLPGWECAESPGVYFGVSRIRKIATSAHFEVVGTCSDYQFSPAITLASGLQCWDVKTNDLIKIKSLYFSSDANPIFNEQSCADLPFPVVDGVQRKSMCVGIFDTMCPGNPSMTGVKEFGLARDQLDNDTCRKTIRDAADSCGPGGWYFASAFQENSIVHREFAGCEISATTCTLKPELAQKTLKIPATSRAACEQAALNLSANQCGNRIGARNVVIAFGPQKDPGRVSTSAYASGMSEYDPILSVASSILVPQLQVSAETTIQIPIQIRVPQDSFGFTRQISHNNADWYGGLKLVANATPSVVSVSWDNPKYPWQCPTGSHSAAELCGSHWGEVRKKFGLETENLILPEIKQTAMENDNGGDHEYLVTYTIKLKAGSTKGRFNHQLMLSPWYHDGLFSLPSPITKPKPVFKINLTGRVVGTRPLWQNPVNPYDVNNDGIVNAVDSLRIINDLNRNGARDLDGPGPTAPGIVYLDVNGDHTVNSQDSLLIINYLSRKGP